MPTFDFIEDPSFRASLESDYAEMSRCFENGAWKSVQVLAGSIVEALLIDYLVASKSAQIKKDPLKMDLAEAVALCRAEKVLTERSADLCSVIRSYRNLIHPGRLVRQNEAQPSESSARIALSLIELITEDVARVRQSAFGLTAEQVVGKIERDTNALAILKHLLEEVSDRQKQRLLLDVIPNRYFELKAEEDSDWNPVGNAETLRDLRKAYRAVLDGASEQIRSLVGQQFVKLLREGEGDYIVEYANAFFSCEDLDFIPEVHHPLIKDHIFSRLGSVLTAEKIPLVRGLEGHLTAEDVNRWLDPIVRAVISSSLSDGAKAEVKEYASDASLYTISSIDPIIRARLGAWERHFANQNRTDYQEVVRDIRESWPGEALTSGENTT